MSERATVDVVIPVWNGGRHIRAAVESALAQTDVAVRVLVVDGGSTDNTVEVAAAIDDPRVTVFSDLGRIWIGAARNYGAARGSGAWLSFLDADDLWPRHRTATLLAAVEDLATDIVFGQMITFADGTEPDLESVVDPGNTPFAPVSGNVLFSREVFETVGGLPEDIRVAEFIDWMARARLLGLVERRCRMVGLYRRSHETNTTRTQTQAFGDYLTVVARARNRQRANLGGE